MSSLFLLVKIKRKIRKLCTVGDDESMKLCYVKQCILQNQDRRYPESAQSRIQKRCVKKCILQNLDRHFPESAQSRIQQLLDSEKEI